MERTAMPANELEGLIRDRLPDAVRRNLRDVHRPDRSRRRQAELGWVVHLGNRPQRRRQTEIPCDHASAPQEYHLLTTERG